VGFDGAVMAKDTEKKPIKKAATKKKRAREKPVAEIDPKMLGVLVCPKTRGPLIYDSETNELISKKAKLAYPIRVLVEEARKLD